MSKRTLEQIKDELTELLEETKNKSDESDVEGLEYVVVRTYSAGVHLGFLKRLDEVTQTVELVRSRRLWKWTEAFTLSKVSVDGVGKGSRLDVEVPRIILLEAIEVIPTSKKAQHILRGLPDDGSK